RPHSPLDIGAAREDCPSSPPGRRSRRWNPSQDRQALPGVSRGLNTSSLRHTRCRPLRSAGIAGGRRSPMLKSLVAAFLIAWPAAAVAEARLVGDLPRKANKPLVDLPGLETEYGMVRTSESTRLRTILTRPAGATERLPAIMLIQWVSCGSVDFGSTRQSELRQIADQSGMVFVRVERSGDGDSEGAPCARLDYDTEVRHYREAFDQIARHVWIDPDRILLFGSSLGSTSAPLVAQGK